MARTRSSRKLSVDSWVPGIGGWQDWDVTNDGFGDSWGLWKGSPQRAVRESSCECTERTKCALYVGELYSVKLFPYSF